MARRTTKMFPNERKAQRALETKFGKTVDAYLYMLGCEVIRVNSGTMKIANKDGSFRYVKFNSKPGCSDRLVCLPDGRFMALELKQGKKSLTKDQRNFLESIGSRNGLGVCVWTFEQLEHIMKSNGYDKS